MEELNYIINSIGRSDLESKCIVENKTLIILFCFFIYRVYGSWFLIWVFQFFSISSILYLNCLVYCLSKCFLYTLILFISIYPRYFLIRHSFIFSVLQILISNSIYLFSIKTTTIGFSNNLLKFPLCFISYFPLLFYYYYYY